MPTITIKTCDVGAYLAIDEAVRDLALYVSQATEGKLPADSSDSVTVSIEAVKIMRVNEACRRYAESKREHFHAEQAKAERKAKRREKRVPGTAARGGAGR